MYDNLCKKRINCNLQLQNCYATHYTDTCYVYGKLLRHKTLLFH